MKVHVNHLPPTKPGIYARVWRADHQWQDIDVKKEEGETIEDCWNAICKAVPEACIVEMTEVRIFDTPKT